MSDQMELRAALVRAQGLARAVVKSSKNEHFVYQYASSEAIISEGREALSEAGLALFPVTQDIVDIGEGENVLSLLKVVYGLVHTSGQGMELSSTTPIIPEKGRPFDKALAAAKTYDLGYLLRGLLLLPRVGKGEDVDERDDRNFDPSRLKSSQITNELAEHMKALGKDRYEKIVGPVPPSDHDAAILALEHLRLERDRDGLIRTSKMILKELGAKDAETANAELAKRSLPSLEELLDVPVTELRVIASTLRKSWKGE